MAAVLSVEAAAALGGRASFARLDVRDEDGWRLGVDALLAEHGRLDILVNNAGVTGFEDDASEHGGGAHDPEHASLADWRAVHTKVCPMIVGGVLGQLTMMSAPSVLAS